LVRTKAYYRFINSPKVTEAILTEELTARTKALAKGRILLAIQDSSEVNLNHHKHRSSKIAVLEEQMMPEGALVLKYILL